MSAIQQLLTDHIDIWTATDIGKKTGRGRASSNTDSVYGIRKLRELILELAVRGKLVPQDDTDEPANELFKRIQEEKIKLISKGEIKPDKSPQKIKIEEAPYQLPPGWKWVCLGDIAQHNSGKTLDKGRNIGKLHDYITTSNLYWGFFELGTVRQMPIRDEELERCSARKGDLLICEGGEAGRAAVWPYEEDICFQNHVHRLRFYCGIDPYYAYRFFEKLNATGEINQYRKGVGISNMSGKALASIFFPLPSIAEQNRIVAKVDELMALCDQLEGQHTNASDVHEKLVSHLLGTLTQSQSADDFTKNWQRIAAHFDVLFTTEASIDALKQTLLQLAVMGKLVHQDSNDEPASALLKRIQSEKAKLIVEGTIKKDKMPLSMSERERPFEIPMGWDWLRLGDLLALITDGDHQAPPKAESGIPFLVIGNLNTGNVSLEDCRFVPESYYEKLDWGKKPQKNDLLYTVTGSYGMPIKVNGSDRFCVQRHVAILKTSKSTPVDYLSLLLKSKYALQYATKIATGIAQKTIPLTGLRLMPIATPPEKEQERIVAKIDELMAGCEQLKSRIITARNLQKQLADVMIEQAIG
jgi:type I restriction enzyme S subunit